MSVAYECVTTGEGANAATTAHILTTVTNNGSGVANNVAIGMAPAGCSAPEVDGPDTETPDA